MTTLASALVASSGFKAAFEATSGIAAAASIATKLAKLDEQPGLKFAAAAQLKGIQRLADQHAALMAPSLKLMEGLTASMGPMQLAPNYAGGVNVASPAATRHFAEIARAQADLRRWHLDLASAAAAQASVAKSWPSGLTAIWAADPALRKSLTNLNPGIEAALKSMTPLVDRALWASVLPRDFEAAATPFPHPGQSEVEEEDLSVADVWEAAKGLSGKTVVAFLGWLTYLQYAEPEWPREKVILLSFFLGLAVALAVTLGDDLAHGSDDD